MSFVLSPGILDSTVQPGEDIVFLATDINLPGGGGLGDEVVLLRPPLHVSAGEVRQELNRQQPHLTWEATPRSIHEGIATAITVTAWCLFSPRCAEKKIPDTLASTERLSFYSHSMFTLRATKLQNGQAWSATLSPASIENDS